MGTCIEFLIRNNQKMFFQNFISLVNSTIFPSSKTLLNLTGYVAVVEEKSSASTEIFSQYPKGTGKKMPWSIISYANGRGFDHHYQNDSDYPWKDLRNEIWTDDQYT